MSVKKSSKRTAERRHFMAQTGAAAAIVSANLNLMNVAHAAGDEVIKVALIGCGGRGSGAARDALDADPAVRIVAVGDLFRDRIDDFLKNIRSRDKKKDSESSEKKGKPDKNYAERVTVKEDQIFTGFDAFQKVLTVDADYVILATPPHFRHQHLAAAIDAKRHVFMEKPVAVDPPGCRSVIESGERAKKLGLSIVAGTQRRHQQSYLEMFKRVQDGMIGKIVSAQCYWYQWQLWHKNREEGWSDMEWMIRDWVNWTWLSGDHICEQHVHNIDVVNWFKNAHPVSATGMGGRCYRPTGDQYDHFAVDFEYDDGTHLASYCRQINGCVQDVSETLVGEKGFAATQKNTCRIESASNSWSYGRPKKPDLPYVQEHVDLIDSIRTHKALNEARNIATSTLTAIMGRTAAYTGQRVTWDEMMKSDMRLGPKEYNFDVGLLSTERPLPGRA